MATKTAKKLQNCYKITVLDQRANTKKCHYKKNQR